MGKFSEMETVKQGVITTTDDTTRTYEGDLAWSLTPVDELFSLLVTTFVENDFYQSEALNRLRTLTHQACAADPTAVAQMARWARHDGNMRSAPIVVACEYAYANPHESDSSAPTARSVVDSVCVRADEPAEILGYWIGTYGKPIPSRVNRGVADAVARLYTERSSLRYDGSGNAIRFGDVIELVRPKPTNEYKSNLYRYLIDKRHNRDNPRSADLPMITRERYLQRLPEASRADTGTTALMDAGFSWERYSGWIPGGMDGAAWDKVIPLMGYMALLRNLRNFEAAGISTDSIKHVKAVLTDPAAVAASRQLPFRFWSAYKNVDTHMFAWEIEQALEHVFNQTPELRGRTLILVDLSGSMNGTAMSDRSGATRAELASVFGAAVAKSTGGNCKVVAFATDNTEVHVTPTKTVLNNIREIRSANHRGQLAHGTEFWPALDAHIDASFDRAICLTDMQFSAARSDAYHRGYNYGDMDYGPAMKYDYLPMYLWDLSGYGKVPVQMGERHYMLTGISDKAFGMINHIEGLAQGKYPWL